MKKRIPYPVIDLKATGRNIENLRKRRGLSVCDLQEFFGFTTPGAIYQWQRGECIPSVDNLYALSAILQVTMNEILVPCGGKQEEKNPVARASFAEKAAKTVMILPQLLAA